MWRDIVCLVAPVLVQSWSSSRSYSVWILLQWAAKGYTRPKIFQSQAPDGVGISGKHMPLNKTLIAFKVKGSTVEDGYLLLYSSHLIVIRIPSTSADLDLTAASAKHRLSGCPFRIRTAPSFLPIITVLSVVLFFRT